MIKFGKRIEFKIRVADKDTQAQRIVDAKGYMITEGLKRYYPYVIVHRPFLGNKEGEDTFDKQSWVASDFLTGFRYPSKAVYRNQMEAAEGVQRYLDKLNKAQIDFINTQYGGRFEVINCNSPL